MIAYVGRGYYKEHIIPIFGIGVSSDIFLSLLTCLLAVQFTILSIIALRYNFSVPYPESEVY